ncbi:MAG: hypothetical protein Q9165_000818 [Trypethelium subeluteriae]
MSVGHPSRSTSRSSNRSRGDSAPLPPPPSITPFTDGAEFEPCAATGSFFLYAQRNVILCLHHDTLAVERRFDKHREDVVWIAVDNVSEGGAGRHVVSYDVGQTAIVWDLYTGDEIARFAAYEQIKVAAWMRNGNIAFGNVQGNVILFEPTTSEHLSARTIFDPVTALAPAADCRTFAIGYLNGSILIAALQPSFTILHTLTTSRAPSQITGLAWHASSSKQKSEMLATQTLDGDLRVWSVPKPPHPDAPNIIRVLSRSESRQPGPCWFAWSKNGRLIQYAEGETRAWDVRTKRVAFETVPTIEGINAIANYGPTATLFTLGRNHTVQQYDLNPASTPILVADVQHVPANAPPSPPNSVEEQKHQQRTPATAVNTLAPSLPIHLDAASEEEDTTISPLQKMAEEMDQLEEERRDRVGPLSPSSSSRASVSSRGSGGQRRANNRRHERTHSSKASEASTTEGTVFSYGSSLRSGHESVSIRSTSSAASYKSSGLRNQVLRSPEETQPPAKMDLFPFVKARLSEVPFRPPHYGDSPKSTDFLRQQMLSVIFGWDDDVEDLIRDELARHPPGSPSSVILSKWLGDLSADTMAAMVGSESMAASDWMLLALSSMGLDSQKKVGEAFVQRLLQKGDIHPAVAIVLGLGELNEAIEIYVSQRHFLEAVLLTCLIFPADWQRQSHLVRKWGEVAVAHGQPELAVRCFSCTSIETSDMWFSPRAQDAVFHAQKEQVLGPAMLSPQLSPPVTGHSRVAAMNSSLKLITSFDERAAGKDSTNEDSTLLGVGVTPIADSAISPGPGSAYLRASARDPSSARTATPGGFNRRRLPSRDTPRVAALQDATPLANPSKPRLPISPADALVPNNNNSEPTSANPLARKSSLSSRSSGSGVLPTLSPSVYEPSTALKPANRPSRSESLPSPASGVFNRLKEQSKSRSRGASRDRKPDNLHVEVMKTVITEDAPSTAMLSSVPTTSGLTSASGAHSDYASPQLTGNSMASTKARSIDKYISSLEEANYHAKRQRADSRQRSARSASRTGKRETADDRGRSGARYIKPAKRSPSSPVPMSPDESYLRSQEMRQDEDYYRVTSPVESMGRGRGRSNIRADTSRQRADSKASRRQESPDGPSQARGGSKLAKSRGTSRQRSPDGRNANDGRGRSKSRGEGSVTRSPSSPLSMSPESKFYRNESTNEQHHGRPRQRSTSRKHGEHLLGSKRRDSPERGTLRDASTNRRLRSRGASVNREAHESSPDRLHGRQASRSRMPKLQTNFEEQKEALARKVLAQKELEERRLSLARRPSAPVIPHPGELAGSRPYVGNRSATEMGNSPNSYFPSMSALQERGPPRSNSVDADSMNRYSHIKVSGTSTATAPIGLPATPRAMRHPRYMGTDPIDREDIPAVPEIPASYTPQEQPAGDELAPLLPSSVFGQKPVELPRSASAPAEGKSPSNPTSGISTHPAFKPGLGTHARRGSHARKASQPDTLTNTTYKQPSPPIVTASIDETLHENQVVIIEDGEGSPPPVLDELRHLATPPPPPPPPSMYQVHQQSVSTNSLGVINIGIEDQTRHASPVAAHPSEVARARAGPTGENPTNGPTPSGSPNMHRRGRNSVSENIGSRIRGVAERMRSTSRSRNKSPPMESFTPSPYETVLPPIPFGRYGSEGRTKSPLETIADSIDNHRTGGHMPPPPPPAPAEQYYAGSNPPSRNNSAFAGYKHPREVRANMPPDQIQPGVYMSESGMI